MSKNWLYKKPFLYTALGLNVLGLAACSSSGNSSAEIVDEDLSSYESFAEGSDSASSEFNQADLFGAPGQNATTQSADSYANLDLKETSQSTAPRSVRRSSGKAYRLSSFPSVASQPFEKDGYVMNSYVFVRNEKSWKDLSVLLYGRDDRAGMLSQWNAGQAVSAGSVVYFSSPFRPNDSSVMKPFESEYGLSLESVVVQPGDSLSAISQRMYGEIDGWREIASLNQSGLSSPDIIEVGQSLQLGNFDRATLSRIQAEAARLQAQAEEELLQEAQAGQVAQTDQLNQEPQDPSEGVGSQAPPEGGMISTEDVIDETPVETSEAGTEVPGLAEPVVQETTPSTDFLGLPIEDLVVMLAALFAIAAGIVVYLRKKQAKAPTASDLLSFGSKKTGTDDE